ncbi:MAG: hypothetical protein AAF354_04420 [Pseudomonadota bacterium]
MSCKIDRVAAFSAALIAACILGSSPTLANEPVVSRSAKALEALCISTQFDRRNLDAQVQSFSHRELPKPSLRKLSVYNDVGYALIVDHAPVTVTLGRRQSDDEVSRNCTVTIKDLDFAEANELLQANYNAEELDRFANGVSQIAVYRARFPDYPAEMYLSVQTGSGLTALSLFEPPTGETP